MKRRSGWRSMAEALGSALGPAALGPAAPSLLALAAAAAAVILLSFASAEPSTALRAFFVTPWSSAWFLGNMLDQAALLSVAALGVAIAFKAGTFNLGGEGQVYSGGLAAAAILAGNPALPGPAALALAGAAAVLAGSAMAAVPGFLKAKLGADEMIATFLLSAAVSPVADFLIAGPLRDPDGSLLATVRFSGDRVLPRLMAPSSLNASLFAALLLAFLALVVLERGIMGFRLRAAGSSPSFARFAGIDSSRYWTPALAVSGGLHGLAGFFAVAGTYGICHQGFAGGLGWNAIAVALIARNSPAAILPAALAYAWIRAGSDAALMSTDLSFETASFVQAAVFLLVTARFFRGKRA